MAAGKIQLQAADARIYEITAEEGASGNVVITIPKEGGKLSTSPSIPTAYHIYNGNLALSNTVTTSGFGTTLYTGNGATQSITTGIDMATQWGNDASETFGGLVWLKGRSEAGSSNLLYDTIRLSLNLVSSNSTATQSSLPNSLTSFNNNGYSVGSAYNTNLATYASWVFQTTHRTSGTTNHGKAYTCHYNPFTGFTIVKYEGSGIAGHEIPHHLGRKLGFVTTKRLDTTSDWNSSIRDGYFLRLNGTDAESVLSIFSFTDSLINLTSTSTANQSGGTFIAYGWANSYFDENSTLIGNYEIGTYVGTGAAGNKVTTRGKPAWVMVKALSATGSWQILDVLRSSFDASLYANLSDAEAGGNTVDVSVDGFTFAGGANNGAGVTYLYMVAYDNDSGSGKSKYPRATDTSTLNLNAHVPYANGIDTNGSKVTIAYKNETLTLSNALAQGKNYIASLNDGTYVASPYAPNYGSYSGFGDYYDLAKQKWFNNVAVFSDDFKTDTSANYTTFSSGTLLVANGSILFTATLANGSFAKTLSFTVGKKYRVIAKVNSYTVSDCAITIGSGSGTPKVISSNGITYNDFVAISSPINIGINIGTNGGKISLDYLVVVPLNADGSVDTSSATAITPRNYLDCIVYADAGGQPTYIEQLPKTEYVDSLVANSAVINGEVIGQLGVNQTWQTRTDRLTGVSYTNTESKPIEVRVNTNSTASDDTIFYVNEVMVDRFYQNSTTAKSYTVGATVPPGATYKCTMQTSTLYFWKELR